MRTFPLPPGLRGASSRASTGDGRPPHTNGYRTRHPMRFWVFRTYKIGSHRSAGTERTINLLIVGRYPGSVLPSTGARAKKDVPSEPGLPDRFHTRKQLQQAGNRNHAADEECNPGRRTASCLFMVSGRRQSLRGGIVANRSRCRFLCRAECERPCATKRINPEYTPPYHTVLFTFSPQLRQRRLTVQSQISQVSPPYR